MRWDAFCGQLKELGYDGPTDQFTSVTAWLRDEGYNTETVEADGKTFDLRDMFDNRPGKPLDASKAAKRAEFEDEVDRRVREAVARLEGAKTYKGGGVAREVKHEVKVGNDRLTDDPRGGFKSAGHFYAEVAKAGKRDGGGIPDSLARWDQVNKGTLTDYGQESVGADGGFAVPSEFRDAIMSKVMGEDSIAARCDQYTLTRNSMAVPDDETTPWQTSGGILANWEGEAGTYEQSKPSLKLKELRLRKLTALVPVTEELLEDATAIEAFVSRKAAEKLDFKLGEAIFRGNGAGQPLGFLNSDALVEVAKSNEPDGQTADTIVQYNIERMWERMYAPYRANAVWFVHHTVEKELMRLSFSGRDDSGDAVANSSPIGSYIAPGGLANSPLGSLLGRPVIVTQHCNELGDAGDIIFADLSQYWLGMKAGGIDAQTSIHLWFDQDAVAYKFRMRVDGQPWLSTPIASRDGSVTQTAFVSLAERA